MNIPTVKRRPLFGRSASDAIPERTAHLPIYDSCPHRGPLLDHSTCGCMAFGCKLHGTCSTQPRSGLKLCQECEDIAIHRERFEAAVIELEKLNTPTEEAA